MFWGMKAIRFVLLAVGLGLAGGVSGGQVSVSLTVTNDLHVTWAFTPEYLVEAVVSGSGSVSGLPEDGWVSGGTNLLLLAEPGPYFHFTGWQGDTNATDNPLSVTVSDPLDLVAVFSADLAPRGTPHWWLAQYDLTNDGELSFEEAEQLVGGEHGFAAWQEFIADTDPTKPDDFFPPLELHFEDGQWQLVIGQTSTSRWYTVEHAGSLMPPDWQVVTNAPGTGAGWVKPVPATPDTMRFFRARVSLPSAE